MIKTTTYSRSKSRRRQSRVFRFRPRLLDAPFSASLKASLGVCALDWNILVGVGLRLAAESLRAKDSKGKAVPLH